MPKIQIESVITSNELRSDFNLLESNWKINATTVGVVESYQWYKNGEKVSGATNNILTLTIPAQLPNNWPDNSYQLVAKNNYGSVTSRVAQIPDRIQWKAADGGNDNYYAVVTDNGRPINWIQASNIAMAFGGHLASVTSEGENKFIYSIIQDGSYWQDVGNGLLGPWIGVGPDHPNRLMIGCGSPEKPGTLPPGTLSMMD